MSIKITKVGKKMTSQTHLIFLHPNSEFPIIGHLLQQEINNNYVVLTLSFFFAILYYFSILAIFVHFHMLKLFALT